MDFQPMTDEEIEKANLIPEGTICYVEVLEASNHIAKESGKESIKLKLQVWDEATQKGNLFVYLTPKYMKLFKHASISMLGSEKYNSGSIKAEDFDGKSCNAEIGVEPARAQYKAKNIIVDFLQRNKTDLPPVEGDLPF